MKRITLNLGPSFLVDDDADVIDLQSSVEKHLMTMPGIESISVRRADVSEVRGGTCKVGPHQFVADSWFPADKPVPDICRQHWYQQAMTDAHTEHQALFDEVQRLTGLVGHIEQTGGMTMTITIPLPEAGTEGDEQGYPCYLGLKEGGEDDSGWFGSLRFYRHYEDYEDQACSSNGDGCTCGWQPSADLLAVQGEYTAEQSAAYSAQYAAHQPLRADIVTAYSEGLPPQEWAARLAAHHTKYREQHPLPVTTDAPQEG